MGHEVTGIDLTPDMITFQRAGRRRRRFPVLLKLWMRRIRISRMRTLT
ncbi:MAG: hypothetical protein ACLUTA_17345 [Blautia wexlerae]